MIQFKTIRSRIYTILSLVIVISAFSAFFYLVSDLKSRTYTSFESVTQTINKVLIANISGYVYNQDKENMKQVIDSIKSEYIGNILILDPKGKVIASQKKFDGNSSVYPYFFLLSETPSHTLKQDKQYSILNTFELLDVPLGYIVVEGNIPYYKEMLQKGVNGLMRIIIPLVILALLAMVYLSASISKPLHGIIQKLQTVRENEALVFKQESEEEFLFLTKSIEEKHNDLLAWNMRLELAVEEKTKALQKLNVALTRKVERAVKDVQSKEQMLQQQARLAQMGEMISMIAHQWRQPLAAITSAMMVVERNIEREKYDLSTKEGREVFLHFLTNKHEEINENIQYLSGTTDDFRNFFNPHTEKVITCLNEPIQKALKLIQSSLYNRGIELETRLECKKECELYANEVMQVFLNILKNASDALVEIKDRKRSITVRTYDTEKESVVEICDNGVGISVDIIENIFDPYFTTKGEKIGTGLGLYMAKNIIEEHHNGKIEVDSQKEWTCFILHFKTVDYSME